MRLRTPISLVGFLLLVGSNAFAQQDKPIQFNVGFSVPLQMISPVERQYVKPSRHMVPNIGISGGVVVSPVKRWPMRALLEFDWQSSPSEYRLSDRAGRAMYTDYFVRDLAFSQLVGIQFQTARRNGPVLVSRPSPLLMIGVGEVFREFRKNSFDHYDGSVPPRTGVRTGDGVHLAFIAGVDLPLSGSALGPVFRLRGRYTSTNAYEFLELGWTVTPSLAFQF